MRTSIPFLVMFLGIGGCTSFSEDHFFESRARESGKTTNYFRVRVSGSASLSKARFVSGYYDERAVDLFFNETKLAGGEVTNVPVVFESGQDNPGTDEVIKPLTPSAQHGSLVMLLSTNARDVAAAIGQFAENQLVADAITNIVNRDVVSALRESETLPKFEQAQAEAIAKELESLLDPRRIPGRTPMDRRTNLVPWARSAGALRHPMERASVASWSARAAMHLQVRSSIRTRSARGSTAIPSTMR